MLFHIIASLVLVAIGFGLGRIKNLKGASAKAQADATALKASAEKALAEAKKL
jgi:hypothetical protein